MDSRSGTASPSSENPEDLYNRLLTHAKKLDRIEEEGVGIARRVNTLHTQIRTMGELAPQPAAELRELYAQGMDQAKKEEEQAQMVVKLLERLLQSRQANSTDLANGTAQGSSSNSTLSISTTIKPSMKTKSSSKSTSIVKSGGGAASTSKVSPGKITTIPSSSSLLKTSASKAAKKGEAKKITSSSINEAKRKRLKEDEKFPSNKINKKVKTSHVKNDRTLQKGCEVAAREPKTRNHDENYIMAKIKQYNPMTRQYEVEDADETSSAERTFWVDQKHVLPIPKREQIVSEFPTNSTVLAIYPHTTTFYKAEVVLPPSKNAEEKGKYLLAFEDDGGAKRPAEIYHVLEYPKYR